MTPPEHAFGHAVVIGASMGGLLAARVLSEHFDRVTIVERDRLPAPGTHRKGTPQARHAHGLLTSGYRTMTRLFPGLEAELLQAGAVPGDIARDARWHQFGTYKACFDCGLHGIAASRLLIETTLRRRVLALPGVELMEGSGVTGLAARTDNGRVTGVYAGTKPDGTAEIIEAELVVDAGGRGSRLPAWLEALGYARPREDAIRVDLTYASCIYRRRPNDLDGLNGAVIGPNPPRDKRLGAMMAMEGDRWIVSLAGMLGEAAPADEQGYQTYARSLSAPDIYRVISSAEPLSDIAVFKFPANLRRYYERLKRFPEGLLVVGDALCSFNPVYGQGMSVAALEAQALQALLADRRQDPGLQGLARSFFRRAARIVDVPWKLAATADFSYPGVEGHRPAGTALLNWYVGRLHRAAAADHEVCRTFFEVASLVAAPSRIMRPRIALRVLRGSRNAQAAALPPPVPFSVTP